MDNEQTWNATFGAYETVDSVLAEADRQSLTPQDYARSCAAEAIDQGLEADLDELYESLCEQLGVQA